MQFRLGSLQLVPWTAFSSIVIRQWCLLISFLLGSVQLRSLFLSLHFSHEQKQLWQLEPSLFLGRSFRIILWMMRLYLCENSCYELFCWDCLYWRKFFKLDVFCCKLLHPIPFAFSAYRVLKVIASLLSPTAFALGSVNFADYERAHVGLRWSNMWRVYSIFGDLPVFNCYKPPFFFVLLVSQFYRLWSL